MLAGCPDKVHYQTPKKNGGLGLKRCGVWSRAMLGKQVLDIAAHGESL